ncbi:hypothetical protein K505DRAFT_325478 [Melanomma pulvis-pyrius CBS 109.77]|uniref:Carboxymuconolactone decarboxylase-like domain-containing protein n=1 Tax=Melanomma pulvis-pyrius CBS 109.77 TaxID=1314802 RepID=A0A6A6XA88_9PLEO|nr:hypothetical protein K505DRAFT_325478 [Melanomma pulvis-pyrius CBS 109.77]
MSDPPRFPPILPSALTTTQKAAASEAEALVRKTFGSSFKLHSPNDALLGPFGILMYTPNAFVPYVQHLYAVLSTPLFSPRERELATLAVCAVTRAQYVDYAHKRIAISVGLTPEQVDAAATGKAEGLELERERVVYELSLEMARSFGRVEDGRWEVGERILGRESMAALVQIVAAYMYTSLLVNLAEVEVPADGAAE